MLLPPSCVGLSLICLDGSAPQLLLFWMTVIAILGCFACAFCIRRRHRVLAWICGALGVLYLGAMLLLPALAHTKTRAEGGDSSFEPNQRASLDAAVASSFYSGRHLRRAREPGCSASLAHTETNHL
jgi:hypothetical protein